MMEPVIYPVTKVEAPLLTAIHRQCFPNYWNLEAFNDFFSVAGTVALLAEMQEPAGMTVYRVQHEQAEIITLAVLPAFRRRGIGSALLHTAMRAVALKGADTLFLDVEDGNLPAIRLYENQGFTVLRRRRLYYRQKDGSFTDALVMSRKL